MKEYACRKCKMLNTDKNLCQNCKGKELSDEWSGLVIILDTVKSNVAQTLGISVPGRYALKVS